MNTECCICFEIVKSSDNLKPYCTPCGHIFHETCIKECIQNSCICPQCNQITMCSELIPLYINHPDSNESKDSVIERLKLQLSEMNEKAQRQNDLIVSLDRQLSLSCIRGDRSSSDSAEGWVANIQRSNTNSLYNNSNSPCLFKTPENERTFAFPPTKTTVLKSDDREIGKESDYSIDPSNIPFPDIPFSDKKKLYRDIGHLMFGDTIDLEVIKEKKDNINSVPLATSFTDKTKTSMSNTPVDSVSTQQHSERGTKKKFPQMFSLSSCIFKSGRNFGEPGNPTASNDVVLSKVRTIDASLRKKLISKQLTSKRSQYDNYRPPK